MTKESERFKKGNGERESIRTEMQNRNRPAELINTKLKTELLTVTRISPLSHKHMLCADTSAQSAALSE